MACSVVKPKLTRDFTRVRSRCRVRKSLDTEFQWQKLKGIMKSLPEDARRGALVFIKKSSVDPSHVHSRGYLRPIIVYFVFHVVGHFDLARERRCVERE